MSRTSPSQTPEGRKAYRNGSQGKATYKEYSNRPYVKRNKADSQRSRRRTQEGRSKERVAHIRVTYGLSLEEYDSILSEPCWVCGRTDTRRVMDHNHESGVIRGAACVGCNSRMGHFGDTPSGFRAFADKMEAVEAASMRSVPNGDA